MNPNVIEKRKILNRFITSHLAPHAAVQAVIATGSIATGLARPDSDIDAIILFDPLDYYIAPAESKWEIGTDNFYSIFAPGLENKQIAQLDFKRIDIRQWQSAHFTWPESLCAELQQGWIAYDRTGEATELVAQRIAYTPQLRQQKLDHAIIHLDQNLADDKVKKRWQSLEIAVAHNRLQSAYDFLIQGLFAYNGQWRPWSNREMGVLLSLPWLPENFAQRILNAGHIPSLDEAGYWQRVETLKGLFLDLQRRCIADGLYSDEILDESFIRVHDEPGRSWNMDEWNQLHQTKNQQNRSTSNL